MTYLILTKMCLFIIVYLKIYFIHFIFKSIILSQFSFDYKLLIDIEYNYFF